MLGIGLKHHNISENIIFDIFQLFEYLYTRWKETSLFSFLFLHFSYTWTIFDVPFSVRCDICRFNRAISLLFFPSSFSQPFPVLFSSSHLIVSLESSLRSRISRRNAVVLSSFAPRARDADAVCRTRAFAFSLQVTEHSIEPGRTVPSGTSSAELSCSVLAHTLSSIPPFSPRFLSTSRFSGSYANRERHHTPVPLIPASSHENWKSI